MKYSINQNYCNFWDLTEDKTKRYDEVKGDFTLNLTVLLETFKIPFSTAYAISRSLWERMADSKLHYHTPLHVMSIFKFAQDECINLYPWEELTIWFHDAIYVPGKPGLSEHLSALFARSMLAPFIEENLLMKIELAILNTANHLYDVTNWEFNIIMDLDLAAFSWDRFKTQNDCIREEFNYVPDEEYQKNRKKFLSNLISKGFIYRSDLFRHRYEAKAMANIKKDLNETPCPA